jgi:RNA polymerase sigma-70 factor, ECF subfamily
MAEPLAELVDNLFRREAGRITAALARRFGAAHLDLAEDIAQEALLQALKVWPFKGVPDDPTAWLHAVARRRAIDVLRRDTRLRRLRPELERELASAGPPTELALPDALSDDELRLLFMCAHPDLPGDARVMLMLKVAGGFSVEEIAHGLLRQPSAVAQALVRAKRRIRERALSLDLPEPTALPERLGPVLDALHLMFSEGYEASSGEDLVRVEVCAEALRLIELLATHPLVGLPRTRALAALFCFQAARLEARVGLSGELVALSEQDRSRFDRSLIARGCAHLDAAASGSVVSEHHLLAAIAAEHVRAANFATTDWTALCQFYDLLLHIAPTPVHRLNRAVVVAELAGPGPALTELDAMAGEASLQRYAFFHATRAEMLRRLGRHREASVSLQAALDCTATPPARSLLRRRLELSEEASRNQS